MLLSAGQKHMLIAFTYFSLMSLGVKWVAHLPTSEIVFCRALVGIVMSYFTLRNLNISIWGKNKGLLFLRGFCGTIGLFLFFYTLQIMPLATATFIQYLSPFFMILISSLLLKEPSTWKQVLCFLMALAGVFIIQQVDIRVSLVGLGAGIIAAFFSALAYNFVRKLKDSDHPLVVVFYFPLVTVPVVGPYAFFHWVSLAWMEIGILIIVGVLTQLAQIHLTKALHLEATSDVSLFTYIGSIYALIFGYVFFGEIIPVLSFVGMLIVLGAVILGTRETKRKKEALERI